jgi:hypothetical protein
MSVIVLSRYTCDGCGTTHSSPEGSRHSRTFPQRWSYTEIEWQDEDKNWHSEDIHLCPECSGIFLEGIIRRKIGSSVEPPVTDLPCSLRRNGVRFNSGRGYERGWR